ncbi:alanine--tRNA ligase [bacterium]|nr:MAG: alanine--tRNA ligase [bacterium]
MKTSAQIRQEFLDFFKSKEHLIVPSAPVVPLEDPTLLFTNAGMNQFKPVFLGESEGVKAEGKVWKRTADTQKCIRVSGKHNDLEEVGHDTYHHTLFEMLGNWSFGDYFKEEAIEWAWELLTKKWGLNPDQLYATVFGGDTKDGLPADEEAVELWKSKTSIAADHILKYGKKDNFWEMGDTGPCGPCSEIHIDLRSAEERAKGDGASLVNSGDPRVMEIWNLVFIQFNRLPDGSLKTLPAKHVDTGMGFERVCAVIQGKSSNYDSDVFTPIINHISKLSGIQYGAKEETDIAMRVIADHIRAVSFSVADGASPGNDGRGYVIRRILRRAIRYGWDRLHLKEPFMNKLVVTLANQFEHVFPELKAQIGYVSSVIEAEEKNFLRTLGQGIQLFNQMIEGKSVLSGEDAFKLHDTYGFPIDLTQLMAREKGVDVDQDGFDKAMNEQKERARAAGKFKVDLSQGASVNIITKGEDSHFIGYDELTAQTQIRAIRSVNGKPALVLSETPFYAESGGQIGDTGLLSSNEEHIRVLDTQKADGVWLHIVDKLPENPEASFTALVDEKRRAEIEKHHSATHLAHAALRQVLGNHVAQKGSLVTQDKLRFDFSHFEGVHAEQLAEIEEIVNTRIQQNIPLKEERNVPIDSAKQSGAMMLFGEKYGEKVRIITYDDGFSKELCGGTHVSATGKIGYFRFTHEGSVASGIRRVEAVTGHAAHQILASEKELMAKIRKTIGQTDDVLAEILALQDTKKALEKELQTVRFNAANDALKSLVVQAETVNGIRLVKGEIAEVSMDVLKQLGYNALNVLKDNSVIVLGSKEESAGKVYLMAAVTDDLIASKGLKAGALVGQLAKLVGGGGGGQPSLATAGGKNPEDLPKVFEAIATLI